MACRTFSILDISYSISDISHLYSTLAIQTSKFEYKYIENSYKIVVRIIIFNIHPTRVM